MQNSCKKNYILIIPKLLKTYFIDFNFYDFN